VVAAAATAILVLFVTVPSAWSDDFVLIRNARNPTASLSGAQIRDLAIGKKKAWPHGPVVLLVLNRADTPDLEWFASSIVHMSGHALLARIREQVFKGEMRKPITTASEQDVLTAVASEEGAIGVVRAGLAKNLPTSVAVLAVR
jgi:ABC-type phosphate transport system substrate-binding protein